MNTSRRTATAADMVVGAIVYKGKGATAWQIVSVEPSGTTVGLAKAGGNPTRGNACYHYSELTVEG